MLKHGLLNTILLLLSLQLLSSCGTVTKNTISQGDYELSTGHLGQKVWDTDLVFNRTSWFRELSMVYDLYLTKVDPKDPFFAWFSQDEKNKISTCSSFYVSLSYSLDNRLVSHSFVEDRLGKLGLKPMNIHNFALHLKMHPDFLRNSLNLYKIQGFCKQGLFASKKLPIQLPGHEPVSLTW